MPKVKYTTSAGLHQIAGTGFEINDVGITSKGTVPTLTVDTAGNGTCTISAESTDVAGKLTFAQTWADGDTVLVTFANAYDTAPQVLLSNPNINGSGVSLIEFDTLASTTAGFTITASGTAAGTLTYFVIETV